MKLLEIRKEHAGQHLCLYTLVYEDADGNTQTYEITSRNQNLTPETLGTQISGVAIMAVNQDEILLAHEFRMGLNKCILDFPAGMSLPGETIEQTAARELKEETGLTLTKTIQCLKPAYTAGPITDDMTCLLICEAAGDIETYETPRENIQASWYSRAEVKAMLKDNKTPWSMRAQVLCNAWVKNEIQIQTPAGTICAVGEPDSHYPNICIDLLLANNTRTRLAMTEYLATSFEPCPDSIATPDEAITGTLKIPPERVKDGYTTPGLVSRTYPNTDPMDDDEHVVFHFTRKI